MYDTLRRVKALTSKALILNRHHLIFVRGSKVLLFAASIRMIDVKLGFVMMIYGLGMERRRG